MHINEFEEWLVNGEKYSQLVDEENIDYKNLYFYMAKKNLYIQKHAIVYYDQLFSRNRILNKHGKIIKSVPQRLNVKKCFAKYVLDIIRHPENWDGIIISKEKDIYVIHNDEIIFDVFIRPETMDIQITNVALFKPFEIHKILNSNISFTAHIQERFRDRFQVQDNDVALQNKILQYLKNSKKEFVTRLNHDVYICIEGKLILSYYASDKLTLITSYPNRYADMNIVAQSMKELILNKFEESYSELLIRNKENELENSLEN